MYTNSITDYINLLAVDTQGTKDDSLKQQPQAVAPSLAGIIYFLGGSMGAEGGRGLAGCACSLAADIRDGACRFDFGK